MNKRNIKNIILLLILLVYSFIHKIYICKNMYNYSESITVAFTLLFTSLSIFLLGYQKDGNSKVKQSITNGIVTFIFLYFILFYGLGFYYGFSHNTLSFDSSFFSLIIIMAIEVFRYVIIKANKDNKLIVLLSTIVITLFELLCSNGALIEVVSRNLLISYLVYYVGIIPGILYRILVDVFIHIIPVSPDISSSINTTLYVGLTFISYLFTSKKVNKFLVEDKKNISNKMFNYTFASFIVLLVCLVSNLFPLSIIGIGSNSMSPELKIGDAVIVSRLSRKDKNDNTIKKGQIIVFKANNIDVVHRVVDVKKINNNVYYITKGDANNSNDGSKLTIDEIHGIVKFKIPYIAKPTVYLMKFLNGER